MVRNGKNPVSALNLKLTSVIFKKVHDSAVIISVNRAVQKSRISFDTFKKIRHITGVCNITTPFARYISLFPGLFILLKNSDARAAIRSSKRRHHSGCTTADNCYFFHILPILKNCIHAGLSSRAMIFPIIIGLSEAKSISSLR